nr:hypothetical protein Iba_chr10bCG8770 [Ipomoea batatas]
MIPEKVAAACRVPAIISVTGLDSSDRLGNRVGFELDIAEETQVTHQFVQELRKRSRCSSSQSDNWQLSHLCFVNHRAHTTDLTGNVWPSRLYLFWVYEMVGRSTKLYHTGSDNGHRAPNRSTFRPWTSLITLAAQRQILAHRKFIWSGVHNDLLGKAIRADYRASGMKTQIESCCYSSNYQLEEIGAWLSAQKLLRTDLLHNGRIRSHLHGRDRSQESHPEMSCMLKSEGLIPAR